MPTENRSSNTETISVPRELTPEMREAFHNSYEAYEDGQGECPDSQWQAMLRVAPKPAPQPHPDPIAWMVGTAFWWTKEEAERDAAAMGLPVVPLGPMGGSGNPSAWLNTATGAVTTSAVQVMDWDDDGEPVQSLYTHADPGEVERLRETLELVREQRDNELRTNSSLERERDTLRARLAEAQALLRDLDDAWNSHDGREWFGKLMQKVESLLASTEPSAPVERDDETLIDALRTCEKWFIKHSPTAPLIGGFGDAEHPMLTCIRAALERKPQVKS